MLSCASSVRPLQSVTLQSELFQYYKRIKGTGISSSYLQLNLQASTGNEGPSAALRDAMRLQHSGYVCCLLGSGIGLLVAARLETSVVVLVPFSPRTL